MAGNRVRLRRHLLSAFGELPLKAVIPLRVRAWVARLSAAGLSPKTVRHCHALLSTLLADAVTEGLLLATPCQVTRLPAAQRYEARFLTAPEVDRLLAVLPPAERTLVLVAVSTGLRWGELAGLRRQRPARPSTSTTSRGSIQLSQLLKRRPDVWVTTSGHYGLAINPATLHLNFCAETSRSFALT